MNKYVEKNAIFGKDVWEILEDFEFVVEDSEEEWGIKEILVGEGEVLGEYISGSINDLYDGFFINKGIFPLKKLRQMADKTPVRVEAVINEVSQSKIKSGKNKGNSYLL